MLKFIFWLIAFYLAFRFLATFIFPWMAQLYLRSVKKKYEAEFNRRPEKKPGEMSIHYDPGKKSKIGDDAGDYVDYEEIR